MKRSVRIGVLNIVTHPHSGEIYQELIRKVHRRKKAGRIRGDRFGMISMPEYSKFPNKAGAFVMGNVGTFTQIDSESDWINISTGLKAEAEEKEALRFLPKDLQPNYAQNRFKFNLRSHKLFFEIGNSGHKLTPGNAQKFFNRMFSVKPIKDAFGDVDVTIVPSQEQLNWILASKSLRSLRIMVSMPNPDDGEEMEAQFKERLARMNVRRVDATYKAERGESIKPDDQLREEAKIAARNGRVDASLVHHGRVVPVSTSDTPYEYVHEYDDDRVTPRAAFEYACEIAQAQLNEQG